LCVRSFEQFSRAKTQRGIDESEQTRSMIRTGLVRGRDRRRRPSALFASRRSIDGNRWPVIGGRYPRPRAAARGFAGSALDHRRYARFIEARTGWARWVVCSSLRLCVFARNSRSISSFDPGTGSLEERRAKGVRALSIVDRDERLLDPRE